MNVIVSLFIVQISVKLYYNLEPDTYKAYQLTVFKETMDIVVIDSDIVDDGCFSQGILMFYITTPPTGTPSRIEGEIPRAGTAVPV